jgi:hypothetical protein
VKAFGLQTRLARDLDVPSVADIPSDVRQEIADAINAAAQTLHALAPAHSKIVPSSIALAAPVEIELTVTNGSNEVTGYDFASDQFYQTLRINGDGIDNQPIGANTLLHPYGGTSGTVTATLYSDATQLPEQFEELVSQELRVLETNSLVVGVNRSLKCENRKTGRPEFFNVEPNAMNQSPPAPAVIRFDKLPNQLFRLEGMFSMAPLRVKVVDLISPGVDLPIREDHIEAYLLPIARANLTTCRLWRNKDNKTDVANKGEAAENKYRLLVPQTISSAPNLVRTKPGY